MADRPAVVLIDIFSHFRFSDGEGLATHALGMLPRLCDLLRQARERQWPVVYINDNFNRWHASFAEVVTWTAQTGPRAAETIAAQASPLQGDYVLLKSRHSVFYHTQFASLLDHLDVREIAIAGMAGDACVLTSVMDGHIRGLRVVPIRDAIASATDERQRRAIEHMEDSLSLQVPSLEDYLRLRD